MKTRKLCSVIGLTVFVLSVCVTGGYGADPVVNKKFLVKKRLQVQNSGQLPAVQSTAVGKAPAVGQRAAPQMGDGRSSQGSLGTIGYPAGAGKPDPGPDQNTNTVQPVRTPVGNTIKGSDDGRAGLGSLGTIGYTGDPNDPKLQPNQIIVPGGGTGVRENVPIQQPSNTSK